MLLLPRLLSRARRASRREAEQAVVEGRVSVNGRICRDVLRVVKPSDRVIFDGKPVIEESNDLVWIALNKPRGVLCTTHDPEGRPTVMALVPHRKGLAPVGRLDQDSAGLLLLSDEHLLASTLLDPVHHVEKRYRVKVAGHPTDEVIQRLRTETLKLDELVLGPMHVEIERKGPRSTWLIIRLSEGKNRQIRRRLEAEGHAVELLIRTAFGPIALADLAPGQHRLLNAAEVAALRHFSARRSATSGASASATSSQLTDTSPSGSAASSAWGKPKS